MTNGEKMQAVFPDIEMWGESKDTLDYSLGGMIHRVTKSWWNAEYEEPTTEHGQKIDKSAMMHEIYMQGVNMAGEYQGCWVRFKEIEKTVDKYVR